MHTKQHRIWAAVCAALLLATLPGVVGAQGASYALSPALADTATTLIVHADIALVVDTQTGAVLFAQNADQSFCPVGTLVTVMAAVLSVNAADKAVTVTRQQLADVRADARKIGLRPGDTPTISDLLAATLLYGAQDAAAVLAAAQAEDREFIAAMTAQARVLGMDSTQYRNYTGEYAQQQTTTAEDMALLLMHVAAQPLLTQLLALQNYPLPDGRISGRQSIDNRNAIMRSDDAAYDADVTGVLSGNTAATGVNLAVLARRGDMNVAVILAGAADQAAAYADVDALLEQSFARYERRDLTDAVARLASALPTGTQTYALDAQNNALIATVYADGYDEAKLSLTLQQEAQGGRAEAALRYDGRELGSVSLQRQEMRADAQNTLQPATAPVTPAPSASPQAGGAAPKHTWLYWALGGVALAAAVVVAIKRIPRPHLRHKAGRRHM